MSLSTPAKHVKKVPLHLQSAQTRLLIKGGKIVNDDLMFDSDIYVEDGIIKQIGRDLTIPGGTRTIEAKGQLIMPGGIDPHTHFELSFMNNKSIDDFYTGTKAALAGGTTMIMDVVLDPGKSLVDAYEKWRNMADDKVCCDYGLHVCIPAWNNKVKSEMEVLVKEKGVNSFLSYLAYKDALMLNDSELIQVFEACKSLGALAQVHAENGELIHWNENKMLSRGMLGPEAYIYSRPEEVEAEAVNRSIVLANQVNAPLYIVNVMGKQAANVIAEKRKKGCVVFGECIAAALALTGEQYFTPDLDRALAHICSPPLRLDPSTPHTLLNHLSSGDLQVTASANLTFTREQKSVGKEDFTKIPPGVNGVEDRMSILWELGVVGGKLSPTQFVALTSSNAAKIFNLYPRKGRIQVGADADIVIWNPTAMKTISHATHHQAVDYNIFEGMTCQGAPLYVISQGRVVLDEGQLHVCTGAGRFIPTSPFSQHVFCCSLEREKNLPSKIERTTNGAPIHFDQVDSKPILSNDEFRSRPPTSAGMRNLQDSTFSLSGAQIDETTFKIKSRGHVPPGGKSTGLW